MDEGPSTEVTVTREDALFLYKEMMRIRRMEAAANTLYKEKAIRGFCHLYSGQEAVAVGMEAAIKKDDAVITAYRAHGWTLCRGVPPSAILTELTGRKSGCARGKLPSEIFSAKFKNHLKIIFFHISYRLLLHR